ncbi:Gaa1-domain-containing protein [Schizopora paradoxa]|uniref:Gaa1-domain-containing protein n=1 Tax=Schizopora paradoxa TaxID=27342 RepID=A0A0H2RBY9_9AGAM|nr:Gaa1-domain-containing protein [Schizopora paradoxa]
MPGALANIKLRLQSKIKNMKDARVRRKRALHVFISRWLDAFRIAMFVVGYIWMLFLPSTLLGRGTYIDENALQPSQVNTNWNWGEVHKADLYLSQLEQLRDSNATSEVRAQFFKTEFEKVGLRSALQTYEFIGQTPAIQGTNAYAMLASPRSSGTEAMVISASWKSILGDESLNLRGLSTLLALAGFLKKHAFWAKDIIFVVGDGHLEGMQAWLAAYHGAPQSNLKTDPLTLTSGVIWNALNIDYPGHSFSHLGIFHEGLNGRLPNQDLMNSVAMISRHTGGVPVVLYNHLDPRDSSDKSYPPSWLQPITQRSPDALEYAVRARNIIRHVLYQSFGEASGVHGLYHRQAYPKFRKTGYRIDAITLFGVPALGPHGFHSLGKIIESSLRTMNNLLERLHASFFFYIQTTPDTFLKIGHYLPSVIIISVAMMFGGLKEWTNAGWQRTQESSDGSNIKWERRPRPVLEALLLMLATHIFGGLVFLLASNGWIPVSSEEGISWLSRAALVLAFCLPLFVIVQVTGATPRGKSNDSLPKVLKALNLCFASTLISVTSLLNFSLSALLAIILGVPLSATSISGSRTRRLVMTSLYFQSVILLLRSFLTTRTLWNWEILGVWFAPVMCTIYLPLLLQAALVNIIGIF